MAVSRATRRNFIKRLGLGAAALAAPGVVRASPGPARSPRSGAGSKPLNILFIFTDDHRFSTIHELGYTEAITPHLDSLVRAGTTFTNAYIMGGTSAAVCMPSRAMLMSGRTLFHIQGQGQDIPPAHVMMPEAYAKDGYVAFGTGKWHNGPIAYARAFSVGGRMLFGGMSDHYSIPLKDFDPTDAYAAGRAYTLIGKHSSEAHADKAIEFLKGHCGISPFFIPADSQSPRDPGDMPAVDPDAAIEYINGHRGDTPFFLYLAFQTPHDPRIMPQNYLDMYDPAKIALPPNFMPDHPFDNGDLHTRDEELAAHPRTPDEIRGHIAAYYAMITHVDREIGRVLETLKNSGQYDSTIVVFSADNGLAVGQHGLMGKQNVYEHSVHVPLIFCGPGIPKNARRDNLCYLIDIYPTLRELTSHAIPPTVEGISLAPVIRGEQPSTRDALVFAYKNFQRAFRDDRWKLIYYLVNAVKTTQFFDLGNDPWEMNNLASDPSQADRIQQSTAQMQAMLTAAGDQVILSEPDWGLGAAPAAAWAETTPYDD